MLLRIVLAFLLGWFLGWITAPRLSSWNETLAAAVYILAICFLAGISLGALIRGRKSVAVVVAFSVSLLVAPAWNGLLSRFEALAFYGILYVLPAMLGGFLGLALPSAKIRVFVAAAAALVGFAMFSIGPPR